MNTSPKCPWCGYLLAGLGFFGMETVCEGTPPVPMLMIQGTADNIVPWQGGRTVVNGRSYFISWPMGDTLGFWLEHDGCSTEDYGREDLPVLGIDYHHRLSVAETAEACRTASCAAMPAARERCTQRATLYSSRRRTEHDT